MHHPMSELQADVAMVGKVGFCSSAISAHVVALEMSAFWYRTMDDRLSLNQIQLPLNETFKMEYNLCLELAKWSHNPQKTLFQKRHDQKSLYCVKTPWQLEQLCCFALFVLVHRCRKHEYLLKIENAQMKNVSLQIIGFKKLIVIIRYIYMNSSSQPSTVRFPKIVTFRSKNFQSSFKE